MKKAELSVFYNGKPLNHELTNQSVGITIPYDTAEGFLSIEIKLEHSDETDFVLFPACCYNGNKFRAKPMSYPPMFSMSEACLDMPTTITDVPRLNEDSTGCISICVGDLAVPCIGVFSQKNKHAYLLFTEQQIKNHNIGFSYTNGTIAIHIPKNRKNNSPNKPHDDVGMSFLKGEILHFPFKWFSFSCASIAEFYELFFNNRKCMGLPCDYNEIMKPDEAFSIYENKWNEYNYNEKLKTYTIGTEYDDSYWGKYQVWQPGWTGGALTSYPLMKLGGDISYKRAIDTLEFLLSTQQECGFFIGLIDMNGNYFDDGFSIENTDDWHMVRKSADILYFLFKHFDVMTGRGQDIPQGYHDMAEKLANAFIKNFNKYAQLGQFVSHKTGEIIVGGSTAGALVPAGLVTYARYYNKGDDIIDIAVSIAKKYYHDYTQKGYTGGGPGEILSSPDSESAFLLLESFVVLYEHTKDDFWLNAAKEQAHICSSWVMSYNYIFPKNSEFGRLDIKTVGSVFANVQNKHSAPGICTLSGNSLYKLYKFTGDERYKELICDIAKNIFQYTSLEKRPIYSRETPPKKLPQGYINERVNTSDWEGEDFVGGVFYGSTWAETSALLTLAELEFIL